MKNPAGIPAHEFLEDCKKFLVFNQEIGRFLWISPRPKCRVGEYAGHLHPSGYERLAIRVNGIKCMVYAHRLAWLFIYGEWPSSFIDHIDGDRLNNRPNNLRAATSAENAQNIKKRSACSSKFLGVSFHRTYGIWQAHIHVNRARYFLGSFSNEDLAYEAYLKAKKYLHTFNPKVR